MQTSTDEEVPWFNLPHPEVVHETCPGFLKCRLIGITAPHLEKVPWYLVRRLVNLPPEVCL
jgi:hypothetical protein